MLRIHRASVTAAAVVQSRLHESCSAYYFASFHVRQKVSCNFVPPSHQIPATPLFFCWSVAVSMIRRQDVQSSSFLQAEWILILADYTSTLMWCSKPRCNDSVMMLFGIRSYAGEMEPFPLNKRRNWRAIASPYSQWRWLHAPVVFAMFEYKAIFALCVVL